MSGMSLASLPPEVVDIIIGLVYLDAWEGDGLHQALRAMTPLALMCRQWTVPAQGAALRFVVVSDGRVLGRLLILLRARPALNVHIRRLRLEAS